ncbi:hypothetical protein [Labrenzia sp. OB1]|uniref:hypothetical protein n=1 Tax=Labrenzia sp. OB1 TaxID=1561204 RepID=UPI0012E978BA|nr:hypothetical protein [Labrenzia sp. OB1]
MSIPLPPRSQSARTKNGGLAWNDPLRELHPHHAVFWPEDLPEHVLLERRHMARALRIRKLFWRRLLRRMLSPFRRAVRRVRQGQVARETGSIVPSREQTCQAFPPK